jgi:hypothetical protein
VIDSVVIRELRSAAQSAEEQPSMSVELLLIGLDEVSQIAGLPADIVGICRCLIARLATTCGAHVVAVILGVICSHPCSSSKLHVYALLNHGLNHDTVSSYSELASLRRF